MKLGFSGTRKGMDEAQQMGLRRLLLDLRPTEFHHGDCVGADAQAHEIVRMLLPKCKIVLHPTNSLGHSAGCVGDEYCVTKEPLQRNRDIVNSTDELVAAPLQRHEIVRSGTWATVRYARRARKIITTLFRYVP